MNPSFSKVSKHVSSRFIWNALFVPCPLRLFLSRLTLKLFIPTLSWGDRVQFINQWVDWSTGAVMSPPRLTGALRSFSSVSKKEEETEQLYDLKVRQEGELCYRAAGEQPWHCCWSSFQATTIISQINKVFNDRCLPLGEILLRTCSRNEMQYFCLTTVNLFYLEHVWEWGKFWSTQ